MAHIIDLSGLLKKGNQKMKLDEVCLDAFSEEDVILFKDLAKDALSLFVYNKNLLSGGESRQIDAENYKVRCEMRRGVFVAPECVFAVIDGASVTDGAIKFGRRTLKFKKNCKKYTVGDKCGEFTIAPFSYLGHVYLPVCECAQALGLSVVSLYQDRLIVISAKKCCQIQHFFTSLLNLY